MTKEIVITVPDHYDLKKKGFNSHTLNNCEKCDFHTPDAGLYIKHLYDHVMAEGDNPETLTTAP